MDFLFPWSMAAGGVLVSSPIIIHLINRMRFKRIRWAAMEFLLKSQKRNRRRLIIEQLILLLLRILLVLLIALIVARFVGLAFGFFEPLSRHHVVVLDDTPSMGDQWKDDGKEKSSFKEGKRLIADEIARNALQASKAQQFDVLLASRPEEKLFSERLSDQSLTRLSASLASAEPQARHVDLLAAIQRARGLFDDGRQEQKILYLVSDFRQTDWAGPQAEPVLKELKQLAEQGVHVKFVDVADPPRREGERDPRFHENLGIVRLEPQFRVVARNMPPTLFTVTVANYGVKERQNVQVRVRLNGRDEAGSSVPIPVIAPGTQVDAVFPLYLDQVGINQVAAYLDTNKDDELRDTGLQVDDTRYATIEVRDTVPILLIDGDPSGGRREGSDSYYMNIIFRAPPRGVAPGFEVVPGTLADLDKPDLGKYPSIYLVNVREFSSKALAHLRNYVKEGGSLAFFLGDQINSTFYNKELYADGTGFFPCPLGPSATPELNDKEKFERMLTDLSNEQVQLFVRDDKHPAFSTLAMIKNSAGGPGYPDLLKLVSVDRHWPVPRARWARGTGKVEELVTLPNRQSIDSYKDQVQALIAKLPIDDPQHARYRARMLYYRDQLRSTLTADSLHRLSQVLGQMLRDGGSRTDADKFPNMLEFWEQAGLKKELDRLRETVQYGDPFLVTGRYGKGRVVVCTTTLGRKWNNWQISPTYLMVMVDLQKWLMGTTGEANLIVGTPIEIVVDKDRYDTQMQRWFVPESKEAPAGKEGAPAAKDAGKQDMGKQPGTVAGEQLRFQFADALRPGVYELELFPKSETGVDPRPEVRGFAFNIDTPQEGDLRRVPREQLLEQVREAKFYTLGSDRFTDLKEKQEELSEGPWLYLIFLLILLAEQALAVHLSFHLQGNQAAAATGAAPAAA